MSVEDRPPLYVCDGCGAKAEGRERTNWREQDHRWTAPADWLSASVRSHPRFTNVTDAVAGGNYCSLGCLIAGLSGDADYDAEAAQWRQSSALWVERYYDQLHSSASRLAKWVKTQAAPHDVRTAALEVDDAVRAWTDPRS